ncbi:MAG TPA: hypothetical protein VMZ27_06300 [Candidatus Saccharimonadales bacterium]|nr:hypothetical protein [Candidatus Saccharimonadales bacterium]
MNFETEIFSLFESWRSLNDQEGNAIGLGDWVMVAQFQNERRLVQDRLAQAESRLLEEEGEEKSSALVRRFREIVRELTVADKQNLAAVNARRRESGAGKGDLNRSSQVLRQIHRAYSSNDLPAWYPYS